MVWTFFARVPPRVSKRSKAASYCYYSVVIFRVLLATAACSHGIYIDVGSLSCLGRGQLLVLSSRVAKSWDTGKAKSYDSDLRCKDASWRCCLSGYRVPPLHVCSVQTSYPGHRLPAHGRISMQRSGLAISHRQLVERDLLFNSPPRVRVVYYVGHASSRPFAPSTLHRQEPTCRRKQPLLARSVMN